MKLLPVNRSNIFLFSLFFTIILIFFISVVFFFDFTADDAFITYRYSENLVNFGNLFFNQGEAINALTSPFHAIVSALLFFITGQTEISNKVLSILLLLASNFILLKNFDKYSIFQILILSLTLLPSSIILWTFGGLETIILFFWITSIIHLTNKINFSVSNKNVILVFILIGFAFLTRYDSVLFTFPIVIFIANKFKFRRKIMVAMFFGGLISGLWLFYSYFYFGNIFPTSYYIKTPKFDLATIIKNCFYIFLNLFYTGVLPTLFLGLFWPIAIRKKIDLFKEYVGDSWWLLLGIVIQIIYGLSMASSHMMFSFRFFVPYLAATAYWIIKLITYFSKYKYSKRIESVIKVFLILLLVFQGYQLIYTFNQSINGLSRLGEYRNLGVKDYNSFINLMEVEAREIKTHWEYIKKDKISFPVIFTYAEGKLPHSYQEAYILGGLISFQGKYISRVEYSKYADYIQILTPRHGSIESQLPYPINEYTLVSDHELFFDGIYNSFQVYYYPNLIIEEIGD